MYKFLRMPFGLRNAGQSWTVLEGLDCIFVYLDNILVASNTVEEHHIHLPALSGDPHSQVQPCARGHCGAAPTIT